MHLERDDLEHSYAWSFGYRQPISPLISTSFSWHNEGHITDHHRDGFGVQLWAGKTGIFGGLDAGVGFGPYRYFDTVAVGSNRAYRNRHGVGLIYSAYVGWPFARRWSATFQGDWVRASEGVRTNAYTIGLTYRFAALHRDMREPSQRPSIGSNTLSLLGGLSVVNSLTSQNAGAYAIEFRRSMTSSMDGTLSLLREGRSDIGERRGVAAQVWLRKGLANDRLALGLGIGPYVAWKRYQPNPEASGRQSTIAGLLTMAADLKPSERVSLSASWSRVVSRAGRDSDIFLAGVGFQF
ncbi:hypothetical protein PAN31117_04655 [Pandoraea anapnoica]|uniref:Uncharacterized protein n=1 Tax=Pandoraea anapnoica TaxID=2508301 RepID=A0A5E5AHM0_9BURK|nr:hypothetical protein PIN31009_04206 [Pandoraea iniqua]VVE73211.1 hypothetical protein PAN31117_04655 [Pandoraea anapnoica]